MTRLPTLNARQVIQALERGGFYRGHQRGSHLILYHPITERMTTVPIHPGDLRRGLLRQIIKQAGLTERTFRPLL